MRNVCVIYLGAEGTIFALNERELIIEVEPCYEAAGPRRVIYFVQLLQSIRVFAPQVPIASVCQHVFVCLHGAALAHGDFVFFGTSHLRIRVLLKRAVVLVEVVETIVDFGVIEVNVWGEVEQARIACASQTLALVVVAKLICIELVCICIEDVGEGAKDDQVDEHDAEAAAPRWCHQHVAHHIVERALCSSL